MKPVIGITCGLDDDSFKVRQDYISAVYNSGSIPVVLPVLEEASGLADLIDGLLLTGGGDIPADYFGGDPVIASEISDRLKPEKKRRIDYEIELLRHTIERGKPILAVCYGMQLLNVLLGGDVFQDIEYQIKERLDHRKGMHGIEIVDLLPGDLRRHYMVNSHHHQAVKELGEKLTAFAISEDGIIEGIYQKDYTFCVGVQWHPERIFFDQLSIWLFESLSKKASDLKEGSGN